MELHELQRMISIIHDKKPKCRGNLRVKVLLKSTHDYVRRSLIDDQLGNPESLLTLLRNSGTGEEPISSEIEVDSVSPNDQTNLPVQSDPEAMDCDQESHNVTGVANEQELLKECFSNQSIQHLSVNISSTKKVFPKKSSINVSNQAIHVPSPRLFQRIDAFKNCNKCASKKSGKRANKRFDKLTKALQDVMKQWDQLMLKDKRGHSYSKLSLHSVKRMKKLLLESKLCLKADFENQSFSQQQLIKLYSKVIKKMLNQCDDIIEY